MVQQIGQDVQRLREAALAYRHRGWSIIPIRLGTKLPGTAWKRFQVVAATEKKIDQWFNGDHDYGGLAVILGRVSGGLVCRDFDTMESYTSWATAHGHLAATLPTVGTDRGRHVYFIGDDLVFRDFGDGEYRGDGHYCLLPPSRHPFGMIYKWLIPLPAGPLPFIADVAAAGFVKSTPESVPLVTESTESTERTESTEDIRGLLKAVEREGQSSESPTPPPLTESLLSVTIDADVDRAILETLPAGVGRRNYQVFQLARWLKAIPRLADAPVDSLLPYVRRWHDLGMTRQVIGTEAFESTWVDFLLAWPKVKFPKGAEPMAAILEKVKTNPIPRAARKYDHPGLRLLVGLCQELQRASGDKPFFLSCETTRKLLNLTNRMEPWRMLFLLRHDRIIEEVEKGGPGKRRASRYRYLGD